MSREQQGKTRDGHVHVCLTAFAKMQESICEFTDSAAGTINKHVLFCFLHVCKLEIPKSRAEIKNLHGKGKEKTSIETR